MFNLFSAQLIVGSPTGRVYLETNYTDISETPHFENILEKKKINSLIMGKVELIMLRDH
jgi:hypothetical protein